MNQRQPLRLQLARVRYRAVVVAEEIESIDTVLTVDLVVHLAQRVVDGDVVGKPELDGRRTQGTGSTIGWKPGAIATDRRPQRAPSDLQAGNAGSDARGDDSRDRVGHAVQRI